MAGLHLLDRFVGSLAPDLSFISTRRGHALQPTGNSRRAALPRRRGKVHETAWFTGLGEYAEKHSAHWACLSERRASHLI